MHDLSLIFPCYNEENRVKKTFFAYLNYLKKESVFRKMKISMVFVNDGSLDRTEEVLMDFKKYADKNINIIVISYQVNLGKGGAIKRGIKSVDSLFYGYIDADLSFGPELLPLMLESLKINEFVIAAQEKEKGNNFYDLIRKKVSNLFQYLANYFVSIPKIDTQRGFKFFSKKAAKEIILKARHNKFAFDLEIIAKAYALNYKIGLVPIRFSHDKNSSITWQDGFRYLFDIFSVADSMKGAVNFKFWAKLGFWLGLILLILFGWVLWSGYFFSDDFTWIWHGQKIGWNIGKIFSFKMSTFYSPMLNLFYAAMYDLFQFNSFYYFLFGLLLHFSSALFLGILVWQLSASKFLTVFSSILYIFAGGAYEPVVWIGANMHSWVTLYILISLTSYIKYFNKGSPWLLIVSLASCIAAFLTKESAIVLPALILSMVIIFRPKFRERFKTWPNIFYLSSLSILSAYYCVQQFFWQRESVWIQNKIWSITSQAALKFPLAIFDIFIPLNPAMIYISGPSASIIILCAIICFVFILIKYNKLKLVIFGLFWLLICVMPVIFFVTSDWWNVLASRYTYLPRIGAIMVIASILHFHIINNTSRKVVNFFALLVIFITVLQILFMVKTVNNEYYYVYNTGRSLHKIMSEIKDENLTKLKVRWDHPFTENSAHIVAAANVIAFLPEDYLIFLKKGDDELINNNEGLLYWDNKEESYKIKLNKN